MKGRLQRPPDFTGGRLDSFRQVFVRHGLAGLVLALIFVLPHPGREALWGVLAPAIQSPVLYGVWGALVLAALSVYSTLRDRKLRPAQLGWIVYLGFLSLWEEWVFRVAIPDLLMGSGLDIKLAFLLASGFFGAMHYFTLRWRWQWCVGALIGGLALSRQVDLHADLLLISAYHWVATFMNTPRPPGQSSRG